MVIKFWNLGKNISFLLIDDHEQVQQRQKQQFLVVWIILFVKFEKK